MTKLNAPLTTAEVASLVDCGLFFAGRMSRFEDIAALDVFTANHIAWTVIVYEAVGA